MTTFFYSSQPKGRPLGFVFLFWLQLSPCLVVFGLWHFMHTSDQPTVESRIKKMGPRHLKSIESSLAELLPGRALRDQDKKGVETFLQALSQASSWELSQLKGKSSISEGWIQPVYYSFVLRGDPFNLPVFLDGLHRTRAISVIEELTLRMEGPKLARVKLKLKFIRPASKGDEWVDNIEAEEMHTDILKLGWKTWVWRTYRNQESVLEAQSVQIRRQIQQDLPDALIAFRRGEGHLIWKPDSGLNLL